MRMIRGGDRISRTRRTRQNQTRLDKANGRGCPACKPQAGEAPVDRRIQSGESIPDCW